MSIQVTKTHDTTTSANGETIPRPDITIVVLSSDGDDALTVPANTAWLGTDSGRVHFSDILRRRYVLTPEETAEALDTICGAVVQSEAP